MNVFEMGQLRTDDEILIQTNDYRFENGQYALANEVGQFIYGPVMNGKHGNYIAMVRRASGEIMNMKIELIEPKPVAPEIDELWYRKDNESHKRIVLDVTEKFVIFAKPGAVTRLGVKKDMCYSVLPMQEWLMKWKKA
jgi:hypothetical protein